MLGGGHGILFAWLVFNSLTHNIERIELVTIELVLAFVKKASFHGVEMAITYILAMQYLRNDRLHIRAQASECLLTYGFFLVGLAATTGQFVTRVSGRKSCGVMF